jgi:hypothetical protein
MRSSGFVSPSLETISVGCALLWIAGVFLCELVPRVIAITSRAQLLVTVSEATFKAVAWSAICVVTTLVSLIFAAKVFPASSVVYFKLNRSYIESHWQIDPVSKLTYFPIAFEDAGPVGKTTIPSRYYVLKEHYPKSLDSPVPGFTLSSGCRNDFFDVHVEEQVYFVFHYSEPDEYYLTPCRITPTLKKGRLP